MSTLALVVALVGLLVLVPTNRDVRATVLGGAQRAVQTVEDLALAWEARDYPAQAVDPSLGVSLGPASGDVTATSVVVWARATQPATLAVEYDADVAMPQPVRAPTAEASDATDLTAMVALEGLRPDTRYVYRLWFERADPQAGTVRSAPVAGSFRTAPDVRRAVSFVVSGDLGGAGYCRHVDDGYAIFRQMAALGPDFFLALGDMIYADNACPARGPGDRPNVPGRFRDVDSQLLDWTDRVQVRETYREHWRYNRADPHFQAFLAGIPMYAMWDDHEVLNDSGGTWTFWNRLNQDRAGYPNLVEEGRAAYFAYTPVRRDTTDPNRLYRSYSWGRDVDLFLLDTRSYRSRNELPDTPENQKSMLGTAQLAWLKDGLARSRATWKLVATSVPLAIATGGAAESLIGRDSWANGVAGVDPTATGFERELLDLVGFMDGAGLRNVVFLSGDVHRALALFYSVDPNGDGRPLRFHELVSGPLSAAPGSGVPPLDPTLNPTLLYGEGDLFNFGYVQIVPTATDVVLVAEVRGADGQLRPNSRITLRPDVGDR